MKERKHNRGTTPVEKYFPMQAASSALSPTTVTISICLALHGQLNSSILQNIHLFVSSKWHEEILSKSRTNPLKLCT